MKLLIALLLIFGFSGCIPNELVKGAHDAARAGVIGAAAADKVLTGICTDYAQNAAKNLATLTPAQVQTAIRISEACDKALFDMGFLIPTAAQVVDAWKTNDFSTGENAVNVACSVAKCAASAHVVMNVLTSNGVSLPAELTTAVRVADAASEVCGQ